MASRFFLHQQLWWDDLFGIMFCGIFLCVFRMIYLVLFLLGCFFFFSDDAIGIIFLDDF